MRDAERRKQKPNPRHFGQFRIRLDVFYRSQKDDMCGENKRTYGHPI